MNKKILIPENIILSQLEKLMKKHDISATELARQAGIPQPTIYRLLHNKTNDPRFSTLSVIADYFSVRLDYFLGKINDQPESASYALRVYSLENFELEQHSIADNTHKKIIVHCPHPLCFAIESTLSMSPKISLGSVILIDTKRTSIDGDIVLVYYQTLSSYAIRVLHKDGPQIELKPISNATEAQPLTEDVTIIGCAFQITTLL